MEFKAYHVGYTEASKYRELELKTQRLQGAYERRQLLNLSMSYVCMYVCMYVRTCVCICMGEQMVDE